MPTYSMRNKVTGDVKEMFLSLSERQEMLDNGEWEQLLSTPNFVGDTTSTMRRAGKDWEDHLSRVKKGAGRNNTIKV